MDLKNNTSGSINPGQPGNYPITQGGY